MRITNSNRACTQHVFDWWVNVDKCVWVFRQKLMQKRFIQVTAFYDMLYVRSRAGKVKCCKANQISLSNLWVKNGWVCMQSALICEWLWRTFSSKCNMNTDLWNCTQGFAYETAALMAFSIYMACQKEKMNFLIYESCSKIMAYPCFDISKAVDFVVNNLFATFSMKPDSCINELSEICMI